jgi:Cof subfamily protein (haloacid dehalogenase superfamily)
MKQAFITDLDHTFLRSDLTLSGFTLETWNRKTREATLSVATARSYKKALQFLSGLHLNAPLVLLDGALVVTPEKRVIDLKLIGKELGDAVIDEGSKFGIYPVIITLEDDELNEAFLYPSLRNPYQERLIARYRGDDNLEEQRHIRAREKNMKIVYMGEESLLRRLHARLQEVFGDDLKQILSPEAYLGCYYLTLLHPLADKAHGLISAGAYVDHDPSRMSVFGDSINDLGMFGLAGTAIAVGNAMEEVKAAADIVLPHTNDEDAVARYLAHSRGE